MLRRGKSWLTQGNLWGGGAFYGQGAHPSVLCPPNKQCVCVASHCKKATHKVNIPALQYYVSIDP